MVDPYAEFFLEQRLGANRAQRDAGAITFDEQFIARRELHLFQHGLRKNDPPGAVERRFELHLASIQNRAQKNRGATRG